MDLEWEIYGRLYFANIPFSLSRFSFFSTSRSGHASRPDSSASVGLEDAPGTLDRNVQATNPPGPTGRAGSRS